MTKMYTAYIKVEHSPNNMWSVSGLFYYESPDTQPEDMEISAEFHDKKAAEEYAAEIQKECESQGVEAYVED